MKFGIQVEGLNAFKLSSDRLLNFQNGRHFDDITKITELTVITNLWIMH